MKRDDIAKCQVLDAAATPLGRLAGRIVPAGPAWPGGGVAVQPRWSRLSLAEWVVLCLVSEKPTHSFAIASLLAKDGSLGQVWHVQKAVAYRAGARLVQLGLITAAEKQPSNLGPARSQLEATSKGEQAARDWLRQPVTNPGDIRSELLVKLALLGRCGRSRNSAGLRSRNSPGPGLVSVLPDVLLLSSFGELRFVSSVANFPRCQSVAVATGEQHIGPFTTAEDALGFWVLPSLLDAAPAAHELQLAAEAHSVV